jgi:delta8-fatty-acid desaturase
LFKCIASDGPCSEHDPDIQHLPFFAVSSRFFFNLYSTFHRRILKFDGLARLLVPLQHYLYFPVLTFGRFNLHALSWMHQLNLKEKDGTEYRLYELSCMTLFWVWYGALIYHIPGLWMKLVFFYLSNASTMLLHLQITLSHFGMSTEDVGPDELFVSKAVRTTMNGRSILMLLYYLWFVLKEHSYFCLRILILIVDCPPWFDWFHGGLNFQIEHHLFPRLPRCNFRKVQPYVMEFCKRNNMKYYTYTFLRGNGVVLGVLKEVAQQIQFLIKSADPSVRFQHEDHDSVKVLKSE